MERPKQIHVIAAVIYLDSKFLVCRRPLHKRHGGLWEFPGGKIHKGESDLEAAKRELREELKVQVLNVGKRLFSASDPDSSFIIEFVKVEIYGKPISVEHSEIRFCTISELSGMQFAPADKRFINEFLLREIL
jgi:8-oxo-dGTP diphosphatase